VVTLPHSLTQRPVLLFLTLRSCWSITTVMLHQLSVYLIAPFFFFFAVRPQVKGVAWDAACGAADLDMLLVTSLMCLFTLLRCV
jgi:hypothetical protein